ncbi:MAG: CoA transferase, partial [Alphaproteobacteria bacterium]|nr:CoA transferase [Alphaproteobacteria bacterium]
PTSIPTGVFETADGHVNIAVAGQEIYERFCDALGAPELKDHPDFATGPLRSENRKAMNAAIDAVTRTNSSEHWINHLNAAGCPCGPIYSMDQVFADAQVQHVQMAVPVQHPRMGEFNIVNQAIKMSRTPSSIRTATPEQGEHTDEILQDLGYDAGAIATLREGGAV